MRRTLLICLLLVIGGCGWQLRGAVELPESLQSLHIEAVNPRSSLVRRVSRNIDAAGIELVDTAEYRLLLGAETTSVRSVSLDRRARAAERELSMSLEMALQDGDGNYAYGPVTLSTRKIYSYDPNTVLAKEGEESLIHNELRDNLAQQVLRALQAAARNITEGDDVPAES